MISRWQDFFASAKRLQTFLTRSRSVSMHEFSTLPPARTTFCKLFAAKNTLPETRQPTTLTPPKPKYIPHSREKTL
jgi:hypothetical protein